MKVFCINWELQTDTNLVKLHFGAALSAKPKLEVFSKSTNLVLEFVIRFWGWDIHLGFGVY